MILLDITQGEDTKVIGDKGYDANKLIEIKGMNPRGKPRELVRPRRAGYSTQRDKINRGTLE